MDFNGTTSEFQLDKDSAFGEFYWIKGECFAINITIDISQMITNLPVQIFLIDFKINMLDICSQMGDVLGASNNGKAGTAKYVWFKN